MWWEYKSVNDSVEEIKEIKDPTNIVALEYKVVRTVHRNNNWWDFSRSGSSQYKVSVPPSIAFVFHDQKSLVITNPSDIIEHVYQFLGRLYDQQLQSNEIKQKSIKQKSIKQRSLRIFNKITQVLRGNPWTDQTVYVSPLRLMVVSCFHDINNVMFVPPEQLDQVKHEHSKLVNELMRQVNKTKTLTRESEGLRRQVFNLKKRNQQSGQKHQHLLTRIKQLENSGLWKTNQELKQKLVERAAQYDTHVANLNQKIKIAEYDAHLYRQMSENRQYRIEDLQQALEVEKHNHTATLVQLSAAQHLIQKYEEETTKNKKMESDNKSLPICQGCISFFEKHSCSNKAPNVQKHDESSYSHSSSSSDSSDSYQELLSYFYNQLIQEPLCCKWQVEAPEHKLGWIDNLPQYIPFTEIIDRMQVSVDSIPQLFPHHKVDFQQHIQTHKMTKKVRKFKRQAMFTQEYFQEKMPDYNEVKITWRNFNDLQPWLSSFQHFAQKTKEQPILLFHGTSSNNPEDIWKFGFNAGCCQNGYLGRGIYLTNSPQYANRYAHVNKSTGWSTLLLVQVIPGTKLRCTVRKDLTLNSHCPSTSCLGVSAALIYDDYAGTADEIFMVFNPIQCLPVGKIEYRKTL